MEEVIVEEVVIVGAGIAGLATALGFHRLGIRNLVLESSAKLRVTGFALTTWTNAWKALEALGVDHLLRHQHELIDGMIAFSAVSGRVNARVSFKGCGKHGEYEVRCVRRQMLLEALESELPTGTIRYSSKLVSIEESGNFKLLHLADGTVIKTKVLIGCDGINSLVAKWLGFKQAVASGRSSIRGYAKFKDNHGLGSTFLQFLGDGVRSGFFSCDDKTVYWYFTWNTSPQDKEFKDNPAKVKQFVLDNLGNVPEHIRKVVETTDLDSIIPCVLKFRRPWELLWPGNISKGNVCVAGDALHPMTPDIGQGGCCALEDAVVLARCLGVALKTSRKSTNPENGDEEEFERIEMGLRNYAKLRRWRSIKLITASYIIGKIQQSNGIMMSFLRDKVFVPILAGLAMKNTDFDCGKLRGSNWVKKTMQS